MKEEFIKEHADIEEVTDTLFEEFLKKHDIAFSMSEMEEIEKQYKTLSTQRKFNIMEFFSDLKLIRDEKGFTSVLGRI